MRDTTFLGISGEIGAGKSTFADILLEQASALGLPAGVFHLADPLKQICAHAASIPVYSFNVRTMKDEHLHKMFNNCTDMVTEGMLMRIEEAVKDIAPGFEFSLDFRKKWNGFVFETPRHMAQVVGTEFLRDNLGDDVHIRLMQEQVSRAKVKLAIIPDVRFPNEQAAMFTTVFIQRDEATNLQTEGAVRHASESHLSQLRENATFALNNNAGLNDLRRKAGELLLTSGVLKGY